MNRILDKIYKKIKLTPREKSFLDLYNHTSKDEYKETTMSESYLMKLGKVNESIISSWENKFGEKKPTQSQKMEFYHLLRQSGHDKETILDTLKGRL
jgi:hypothetical protein